MVQNKIKGLVTRVFDALSLSNWNISEMAKDISTNVFPIIAGVSVLAGATFGVHKYCTIEHNLVAQKNETVLVSFDNFHLVSFPTFYLSQIPLYLRHGSLSSNDLARAHEEYVALGKALDSLDSLLSENPRALEDMNRITRKIGYAETKKLFSMTCGLIAGIYLLYAISRGVDELRYTRTTWKIEKSDGVIPPSNP